MSTQASTTPSGTDPFGVSLGQLLNLRAAQRADHPFVSFPDGDITYREFHASALGLAKGLVAAGLRPGGHVGILMPNCVTYLELLFAVHMAGGVAVPINARFRRRELAFVLAHSDVEILVTTDLIDEFTDYTALVGQALPGLAEHIDPAAELRLSDAPRLRRIYLHGTRETPAVRPLSELVAAGRNTTAEQVRQALDARSTEDTAVLLYTSGTTADPKGCELTHGALVRSWSAYADLVDLGPDESMWTPCPFFHVGGIGPTLSALVRGATVLSMGRFDAHVALAHIERRHAEHLFPAFPPLTLGLLRTPDYDPSRLTFVRTVLNVAPGETQQVIADLLPDNAVLLTDFGMTEGAGMITTTPTDAAVADRVHRNGVPLPGIEIRVTDPEQPTESLPVDIPGEIQFRGINAFRRYYKDPAETAATIIDGGWVRTGDLGSLDARGQLLYVGRIKDILKVGGENVTPLEVEAHLTTYPGVHMAQVVGRPSERYGEEPVAFVELASGATCTGPDLITYCRDHLASYKVPREIRFVTEWPMSATKIQKFKLRELLA
ncbi:MAG: acyl--CoA ligase [Pseudonocardia sp.]|uniref:class I adenylate-forming enzyme family protein n=1 Tax=Pseudonocardia sp. TaxID=60912 RepID=UPI001ACBAB79|nr:class I adenylate-forming enzyme family protein [Pseudonocardia sp.]MBN9096851.1 acyl--CoA ligase [Pseudonocardia sp.]